LRVHGPEPCASANSATSALEMRQTTTRRGDGNYTFIVTGMSGVSNRAGLNLRPEQGRRENKKGERKSQQSRNAPVPGKQPGRIRVSLSSVCGIRYEGAGLRIREHISQKCQ
ncbi:MAG TPA: hypothetical protein VLN58_07680, partial [Verrucomicrobiae bacterium]|nr:hypothetical protein [Verrucomicrobiae bacterium]